MIRNNLKNVHKSVSEREPFNCNGTLTGVKTNDPKFGWAKRTMAGIDLANHIMDSTDNFVIYSYDTPIAVHNSKGWWVNGDKYTVTTSRHMSAIRKGIN